MTRKTNKTLPALRELVATYRAEIDEDMIDACTIIVDLPRDTVWRANCCHSIISGWSPHWPAGRSAAIADAWEQVRLGTTPANAKELEYYDYHHGDEVEWMNHTEALAEWANENPGQPLLDENAEQVKEIKL